MYDTDRGNKQSLYTGMLQSPISYANMGKGQPKGTLGGSDGSKGPGVCACGGLARAPTRLPRLRLLLHVERVPVI